MECDMRVMGLDIGAKRIGVAISDETGTLAQGKGTVSRKNDLQAIKEIKDFIEEYKVEEIILGLPLHMDGTRGERAQDSLKFAEKLKEETGLPVKMWDERLSTKEVEDMLIAASVSRAKRKKVNDKLAAQIILQGYLDSLKA
jgi:putative Holliday junction resolvase